MSVALVAGGSGHTCFLTPEEEEMAERGSHASPLRCRRPRAPRPGPLGSGYTGLTGGSTETCRVPSPPASVVTPIPVNGLSNQAICIPLEAAPGVQTASPPGHVHLHRPLVTTTEPSATEIPSAESRGFRQRCRLQSLRGWHVTLQPRAHCSGRGPSKAGDRRWGASLSLGTSPVSILGFSEDGIV